MNCWRLNILQLKFAGVARLVFRLVFYFPNWLNLAWCFFFFFVKLILEASRAHVLKSMTMKTIKKKSGKKKNLHIFMMNIKRKKNKKQMPFSYYLRVGCTKGFTDYLFLITIDDLCVFVLLPSPMQEPNAFFLLNGNFCKSYSN